MIPHLHRLALGFVSLLVLTVPASADAIRTGFTNNPIAGNDDASFGPQALGFNANFFGNNYSSVFINTNGNLTFDSELHGHTPFDLTSTGKKIIAPFFADVDTTVGNAVTWGTGTLDGHNAFAVSWPGVGFFSSRTDLLNNFQAVLIDRADTGAGNFDIEFNYSQIQWETGSNSGGVDGLGGASARVGFSDGTGNAGTAFELLGSAVNGAFLDNGPDGTALIKNKLNSDVDGRYVFHSRSGKIDPANNDGGGPDPDPDPNPSETPEPASLVLAGVGLVLLAGNAVRRLRRFPKETFAGPSVQVP